MNVAIDTISAPTNTRASTVLGCSSQREKVSFQR
jgi:hypothetical protein